MEIDTEVPAFTDAPDEGESLRLTELGRELFAVDKAIADAEALIEIKKKRRNELTMVELPAYMQKIGQDKIGLPEFNVDLVTEAYYHANIKAEWPEDQREAGFSYLEEVGSGDMIKMNVVFAFGRREIQKVKWLMAFIRLMQEQLKVQEAELIPDPIVSKGVPWNTLTAWLKERVTSGLSVDLEKIGGTVGVIVKIKPRKK